MSASLARSRAGRTVAAAVLGMVLVGSSAACGGGEDQELPRQGTQDQGDPADQDDDQDDQSNPADQDEQDEEDEQDEQGEDDEDDG